MKMFTKLRHSSFNKTFNGKCYSDSPADIHSHNVPTVKNSDNQKSQKLVDE